MRLASLLGPDFHAALESDPDTLRDALAEFRPEDIAEIVEEIPSADAVAVLQLLSPEVSADVVAHLSADRQVELLPAIDRPRAAEILSEMDPDDRVDLVQELDEKDAEALLAELDRAEPGAAEVIRELVAYGPDTAGGLMTTEVVALPPDTKVWSAIDELRKKGQAGEVETIYYVYVVAFGKLVGVVSLRDLILADPGQQLGDVMEEKVVRVLPLDDQEAVAKLIARYDLPAVPVVDKDGMLLGVVTVDDVVDVVIEEATEDAQKMGGVVPLADSYFATGLKEFVWKRGAWLFVLTLGQMLTATVMEHHESVLRTAVELVVFVPMILSCGGNAGSQSSTLVIRALSVGEVLPGDWLRVLAREIPIGLALGLGMGTVGFLRALFTGGAIDPWLLGGAIGASVVAIVTLSTSIGSLMPMVVRRIGFDPAVSSTPFIASLVDVFGLMVYFGIARVALSLI